MSDPTDQLRELIANDPTWAADLMAWVERSRAVGSEGAFVAYRASTGAQEVDPAGGLRLVRRCGESSPNRLLHADNLVALDQLTQDGLRFRCAYIDPPYGTRQQFVRKVTDDAAYCDAASGAAYLASLRARLVVLRDLLADDGSLFVHLDSSMIAEAKLLLDELFGSANFRGWITRRKCSSKNGTSRTFGDVTDYILFYSKTASYVWNRQYEARSPEQEAKDFPKIDADTGRRFALVPLHAPGRRNGATGSRWRGMLPPDGKHWQWTPEKLDAADAKGDIYWTRYGTPRRKIWADESPGTAVSNLWHDFRDPFNQNFAITGYPTEKNEDLLRRIISAASNPGDLVLDCYSGSGTTLAAASQLGRHWVGVDKGPLAIALSQRRLAELVLRDELRLHGAASGFEVWSDSVEPSAELGELEFALVEDVRPGHVPQIVDVVPAAAIPSRYPLLPGHQQLVAFDHGGRSAGYEVIQSAVSRPA